MMSIMFFANLFTDEVNGQPVLKAMPLLLGALCVVAIAWLIRRSPAVLNPAERERPRRIWLDGGG